MFKNVEELRDLIKQGKPNMEIIKSQIEYLNSDTYCISKHETIKKNDTDVIIFHQGFINQNTSIIITCKMSIDVIQ